MKTIGIDPGAKYTGVSVRDGSVLLLSSTYVKPEEMPDVTWAVHVTQLITEEVIKQFPDAQIGIENVIQPNPYHKGKLALNNPKHIIKTSIILGAIALANPTAVIIRPRKNGSQNLETYPPELIGRRPKTLPGRSDGAGTRNHEKSAWDIAGETEYLHKQGYILDNPNGKNN